MAIAVKKDTKKAIKGVYTDLSALLRSRHWARDLKLFSRQAARSMLLGETRSRFRGRGMEFEEVRPYQPGDDIRNIDWRVSARTGGTYTKLFCEERERPVHILVDQRSSMFFGSKDCFKSVLAAEIAAGIAWAALAGSDRIGGQVIGDCKESDIRARRNKQAVLRFIHDINEFNQALPGEESSSQISLAQMFEECRRITRPGTAIFVISDFHDFDESCAKALSTLGRHTDVNLIHVFDTIEEQIPIAGSVSISDGLHRSSVSLNSSLQKAYLERIQGRQKLLNDSAVRARALYTKIGTDQEPRQFLNKIYGK